ALNTDTFCVPTDLLAATRLETVEEEQTPPETALLALDDIEAEKIDWIWPQVIAAGKLNLIGGLPGLGKSQITIAIAARLSGACRWPASAEAATPGSTLFFVSEDGASDTIKPRFQAAGVSPGRIFLSEEPFSLRTDLDRIIAIAEKIDGLRL